MAVLPQTILPGFPSSSPSRPPPWWELMPREFSTLAVPHSSCWDIPSFRKQTGSCHLHGNEVLKTKRGQFCAETSEKHQDTLLRSPAFPPQPPRFFPTKYMRYCFQLTEVPWPLCDLTFPRNESTKAICLTWTFQPPQKRNKCCLLLSLSLIQTFILSTKRRGGKVGKILQGINKKTPLHNT